MLTLSDFRLDHGVTERIVAIDASRALSRKPVCNLPRAIQRLGPFRLLMPVSFVVFLSNDEVLHVNPLGSPRLNGDSPHERSSSEIARRRMSL